MPSGGLRVSVSIKSDGTFLSASLVNELIECLTSREACEQRIVAAGNLEKNRALAVRTGLYGLLEERPRTHLDIRIVQPLYEQRIRLEPLGV